MKSHHETIIKAAFDAAMKALIERDTITERDYEEAANYHEEMQRGWMNDIDQEDQNGYE